MLKYIKLLQACRLYEKMGVNFLLINTSELPTKKTLTPEGLSMPDHKENHYMGNGSHEFF